VSRASENAIAKTRRRATCNRLHVKVYSALGDCGKAQVVPHNQCPAVVIAAGGPTGLMLASEMTLAGIDLRSSSAALAGSNRCSWVR